MAPFLTKNLIELEKLLGTSIHVYFKSTRSSNSDTDNYTLIPQKSFILSQICILDRGVSNMVDTKRIGHLCIVPYYSSTLTKRDIPATLDVLIQSIPIPNKCSVQCIFRYGYYHENVAMVDDIFSDDIICGRVSAPCNIIDKICLYNKRAQQQGPDINTEVSVKGPTLDSYFLTPIRECMSLINDVSLEDDKWVIAANSLLDRVISQSGDLSQSNTVGCNDYLDLNNIMRTTKRKRVVETEEVHTLTTVRRVVKDDQSKRKRRRKEKTWFMHLMDVRAYINDQLQEHPNAHYVAWPPNELLYPITPIAVDDTDDAYNIVEVWHERLCMDNASMSIDFASMSRSALDIAGCISIAQIVSQQARTIVLSEWIYYVRQSIFPKILPKDASIDCILKTAIEESKLCKQGSGPVANLCFLPAKMLIDGSPVLKDLFEKYVYRPANAGDAVSLIHEPSNFFIDIPTVRKQRRTLLYDNLFDATLDHRDRYSGLLILSCAENRQNNLTEDHGHGNSNVEVLETLINAQHVRQLMRAFFHPSTGFQGFRLKDAGQTQPQQLSVAHFDIIEFNNFVMVYAYMAPWYTVAKSTVTGQAFTRIFREYRDFCQNLLDTCGPLHIPEGPFESWLPRWVQYSLSPGDIHVWNNKCPIHITYKPENDMNVPLIAVELDYQPIDPSHNGTITSPWYEQRLKRLLTYNVRSDRCRKVKNQWEWPMVSTPRSKL